MGVHGRSFVGKASTRSTLNSGKNKRSSEETNSQLKNISSKSSTSLSAAGTEAPDEPGSVAANMAPALTEPLSPSDKLLSSEVGILPEEISIKEAGETQIEPAPLPSTSSTTSGNNNPREKRSSSRNVVASTRITRSKDSPIIQERSSTPSTPIRNSPIASSTRKLKSDTESSAAIIAKACERNVNDPMGLSAATPSNATSASNEKQLPSTAAEASNNNNTIACKDTSTEKLLADLTTDFEETITAEICLRKQLPEVKVSTPDTAQLSASETEPEIIVIKADSAETAESSPSKTLVHMEAPSCNVSVDETKNEENKVHADVEEEIVEMTEESVVSSVDNETVAEDIAAVAMPDLPTSQSSVESNTVAHILGVEDLPPTNSDSTMTASEEETEDLDTLEERLSQLDGTAATPSTGDETSNITITPSTFVSTPSSNTMVTTSTPPRTPSHLLTPTAGSSALTPQQLLLTPTSSSSQTLALTPQSTCSLLREVGATVTGGEIEDQEFEEVLKALKGFDANSASADTVLDLNVLFSEVYTSLNCEDIGNNQQHQNMLSTVATTNVTSKVTLNPLKELHGEVVSKQQSMQRKIDFIMRRLRKMQVRYMCKHTTEEIAGLFELAARITNKEFSQAQPSIDSASKSVISARPPAHSWEDDIKQPVPSSQVEGLLQRLETSANTQQLCTTTSKNVNLPSYSAPTISSTQQLKKSKKLDDSTNTSVAAGVDADAQKSGEEVIPTLSTKIVDELTHVAGMLKSEMRDVQTAYDSDATESSSGCESADEMVAYNNQVQQSLSIVKRAAWRYSRERAAIASRWSWLLSQIADLEIKIRQHNELYQEVVRTKGTVACEEELTRTDMAKSGIVNAYGETEEATLPGASRTRGFIPTQFRKRKLLQTTNLHTISKKAARPSTIKCGCQWPMNPCALCTGRTDPTAPRDLPDTMMLPERVALLEPGFHPVLSFPEDVHNSIHMEAIARTSSWQQRITRIQPKSVARSIWKAEREAANSSSHNLSRKFGDVLLPNLKRRYIRRKERGVTSTFSIAAEASASTTSGSGGANGNNNTTDGSHSSNAKIDPQTMGNGTANLFTSTTSTTPLGANNTTTLMQVSQSSKRMQDGVLLGLSAPNNSSQMNCQMPQNFDPYNPNQAHSSLISNPHQQQLHNSNNNNKKGKQRKATMMASFNNQNSNSSHSFQHNYNNSNSNNSTQIQQNYLNGDINSDYWDSMGGRSRTASPTHGIGGGSNYHKYERSLERRNRISYDIDNIVIPYSVAAATRVEILPYKEIPTPKWRVFDEGMEEIVVEDSFDQTSNESMQLQQMSSLKPDDDIHNDVSIKDVSKLNNDTKVEHDYSNAQNVFTESEESAAKKDESTSKGVEKIENSDEVLLKVKPNSELSTNSLESYQVSTLKTNNLVTNDTSFLKNIDEPPAKKIRVSMDSKYRETFGETQSAPLEQRRGTEDFENENQDKEQILLSELEEDISDEAFILRHERALNEERRKFQTYLKFPWSTRSRANRRIDSRNESSGANTPDPASPAPNTPSLGGGDQESIPSPLAPSTPITPLETINETPDSGSTNNISSVHSSSAIAPPALPTITGNISSKRNERRRTTSLKNQHMERSERRSLTPDSREIPFIVPPYEPLQFPLSDETFEMLSNVTLMPPNGSTLFADDYISKDDGGGGGVSASGSSFFKSGRSFRRSSSVKNEFIQLRSLSSKNTGGLGTTSTCDLSGKKRKTRKRHSSGHNEIFHQVAESSNTTKFLPYINGQSKGGTSLAIANATTYSTDIDDDTTEDIDEADYLNEIIMDEDDDDDGYSKHPLAPGVDIDEFVGDDEDYNAYVGGGNSNSLLGVSDTDSEADPFEDDDPNDPEWKGEPRSERSEKFRKRS